jgi:hypothetical protein
MPVAQQPNLINPEWLFGEYFATIKKYFERLHSYRNEQGVQIPLTVRYGTPAVAYRDELQAVAKLIEDSQLEQTFNGKIRLPMFNFFAATWKRKLGREPIHNPYVIRYEKDKEKYLKTQVPFVFDVTINCSLWASSYRERDDLLFKLYNLFPRNEISLPHVPDKNDPYSSGTLINIVLNEEMTDSTEIEGLDERETRDVIRTDFTMQTELAVARYGYYVDVIKSAAVTATLDDGGVSYADDGIKYNMIQDPDTKQISITLENYP